MLSASLNKKFPSFLPDKVEEGVSEENICENLSSQGVASVRRIKVRRNNELVPTNTLILTFNKPLFPQSVKSGYFNIPAVPYIPNPLR